MDKWEYKTLILTQVTPAILDDELNRLGAQGWEVVRISGGDGVMGPNGIGTYRVFLKRRKP